jgi:hypothetical protein
MDFLEYFAENFHQKLPVTPGKSRAKCSKEGALQQG